MHFNYLRSRPFTTFTTSPLSVRLCPLHCLSHLSLLGFLSKLAVHMSFLPHVLVIDPYVLSPRPRDHEQGFAKSLHPQPYYPKETINVS